MPQDAFTIRYVADELKKLLTGGKISRIVQPARDELTFIIYTGHGNVKLDACLSARDTRLSLSQDERPVPKVAPNFCMLLRKHLQNAEILDVVQPGFERIIYFDLKCVSDFSSSVMRLYFEIMGKYSNAVLCENGIIVGALKTTSIGENTRRVLFGGVKYVLPEPQDKVSPYDGRGLARAMLNACGDRAKYICERVAGISYVTALEMVATFGEDISADDIREYVFNSDTAACVTYDGGRPSDFKVRSNLTEKKSYASLLEAQSAYYSYVYNKRRFTEKKTKLEHAVSGAVKKAEKRLGAICAKLDECRDAETVKLKGELITANIYAVQRGMGEFYAVNYYDPECGQIKIELDKALTPSQNAQKYYKRYSKLKRTLEMATAQREETEQKIDYLNSIKAHICAAETLIDLEETEEELTSLGLLKAQDTRRKKAAATPYRTFMCDGFKIIAGRNNLQNERLTKGLSPEDMWLHTQKYHSSHVGILCGGKPVPDGVLMAAAEICAYYSDARAGSKIPVDYTLKKFVKKPPKTVAGFVIYTDYNTVLAEPDPHAELAEDSNE